MLSLVYKPKNIESIMHFVICNSRKLHEALSCSYFLSVWNSDRLLHREKRELTETKQDAGYQMCCCGRWVSVFHFILSHDILVLWFSRWFNERSNPIGVVLASQYVKPRVDACWCLHFLCPGWLQVLLFLFSFYIYRNMCTDISIHKSCNRLWTWVCWETQRFVDTTNQVYPKI